MARIPWEVWTTGGDGSILCCRTCLIRIWLGKRSTLRSGGVPVYKTERGAGNHGDRFPGHRIVGVAEARDLAVMSSKALRKLL